MMTNLQNKDAQAALIEKLLDSPLAAELQRSLNQGADAVRRRAAELLEQRKAANTARISALRAAAQEANDAWQAARLALEEAERRRNATSDDLAAAREQAGREHQELRQLSTASAQHLESQSLHTVEDLDRRHRR